MNIAAEIMKMTPYTVKTNSHPCIFGVGHSYDIMYEGGKLSTFFSEELAVTVATLMNDAYRAGQLDFIK